MYPTYNDILHYGMPRRSGRYPWGSGENPYQHETDFLDRVYNMRDSNYTYTDSNGKTYSGDTAIAKSMGLSTTQFRVEYTQAIATVRSAEAAAVKAMSDKGMTPTEIAKAMGYNSESSVRALLNQNTEARRKVAQTTADVLKKFVDENGMLDVGASVQDSLGISREKLNEALYLLEKEGYYTFPGRMPQVTNPGQYTTIKVLCPPGTPYKVNENGVKVSSAIYDFGNIHTIGEANITSKDGGDTYQPKFVYPASLDSSRIQINYAETGGTSKDGLIELRRGCADLDLGNSKYAQVRILVDGTHYLKGMAVYSDNMPDGVDVVFNTNKTTGTPMCGPKNNTVLKNIKSDPDNPFGSLIKDEGGQSYYTDSNGEKKLSLINKAREEGDWERWSDTLASQFLSKQSQALIDRQLGISISEKQSEFDEICSITNPTVKKKLLESFANDCDKAAVTLKAAALPGQRYQVILPLATIGDSEIYAPNYSDGEKVALVRYPHGGTFEIPILTVNNKNSEGRDVLTTNPVDAVGISAKVAERLSGADFDGDTVMVIPCNSSKSDVRITSTSALKDLEGFDAKITYGGKADGTFKKMTNTQTEMGMVSNLITDMTLAGASTSELARAVKHSMVVIDAEKHGLDYKQSEIDNGIAALRKKYLGHYTEDGRYSEGSATIISRAKSQTSIPKTQGSAKINQIGKEWYDPSKPEGALIYKTSDDVNYQVAKIKTVGSTDSNATIRVSTKGTAYAVLDGETEWTKIDSSRKLNDGDRANVTVVTKRRLQKSTAMADTDDAMTLVSPKRTTQELAYAKYANTMKNMANEARKTMVYTGNLQYSSSAKATYAEEVKLLNAELSACKRNQPLERRAQALANAEVSAKKKAYPNMSSDEIKKASQQALTKYRIQVGASNKKIDLSKGRLWEAVCAGAISENTLNQLLRYADMDVVRQLSTSSSKTTTLSTAKINKIKSMSMAGYTNEQIATQLGISKSTIWKYLKEEN